MGPGGSVHRIGRWRDECVVDRMPRERAPPDTTAWARPPPSVSQPRRCTLQRLGGGLSRLATVPSQEFDHARAASGTWYRYRGCRRRARLLSARTFPAGLLLLLLPRARFKPGILLFDSFVARPRKPRLDWYEAQKPGRGWRPVSRRPDIRRALLSSWAELDYGSCVAHLFRNLSFSPNTHVYIHVQLHAQLF